VTSYRQLAWTAGWHLREETYGRALATLVNAQQRQPLAKTLAPDELQALTGSTFTSAVLEKRWER
jgi:TnpA family transposase